MTPADILTTNGLKNAAAIVAAAHEKNTPLHIAAAFVEQESGGANVYGHDAGGLFPGEAVTQANFNTFVAKVVRDGHTSNGVGPLQITYPGYFTDAKAKGYQLWTPLDNLRYGLTIINSLLAGHTLNQAAQLYNSGSAHGAPRYGASIEARAAKWSKLLASSKAAASKAPKWPELVVDGVWGSATTKALQAFLKVTVDGYFGPGSIKALQRYLNARN